MTPQKIAARLTKNAEKEQRLLDHLRTLSEERAELVTQLGTTTTAATGTKAGARRRDTATAAAE